MIKQLKRLLPESIKAPIKSKMYSSHDPELEKYIGKKKIFVMLSGFYQNLGDMALTYSQKTFLENNFPEYNIILIPSTQTYQKINAIKKIIDSEDIFTTIGGGNMDDLYTSLENARRYIIKSFPNNKIVSFPQTIAFRDTEYGLKRKNKTIKTYSKHKNLTVFAREKKSLSIMEKAFQNNNVQFCPDIVLSLNKVQPRFERSGVVYCVRDDLEAHLTLEQRESLKKAVNNSFNKVEITDTTHVTLEECSPERYIDTLEKFWLKLKKSEVIVTDRLHTMIFCAITKSPCVVLSNSNHKIKGTYSHWLKDLDYIKYLDEFNIDEIIKTMKELKTIEIDKCKDINLVEYYKPLKAAIES